MFSILLLGWKHENCIFKSFLLTVLLLGSGSKRHWWDFSSLKKRIHILRFWVLQQQQDKLQVPENSSIIGDSSVIWDSNIINRGNSSSAMLPVPSIDSESSHTSRNGSKDSFSLATKADLWVAPGTVAEFWSLENPLLPFTFPTPIPYLNHSDQIFTDPARCSTLR